MPSMEPLGDQITQLMGILYLLDLRYSNRRNSHVFSPPEQEEILHRLNRVERDFEQ